MNIFTPKGFLQVGGIVLLVVGVLGYFGIIGPTSDSSIFGTYWVFDNAENIAHVVLGIVALLAVYFLKASNQQKWLVALVGILGVLFGIYSLFGPIPTGATFLGAALQNPTDTILHLVIGVWALVAAFKKENGTSMGGGLPM